MPEQLELLQHSAASGWWMPTNVMNLRAILASGLLKPRNGFTKYYPDLLARTPGGLPIVAGGLHPDVELAARGGLDGPAAVLLELDDTRVSELLATRAPGQTAGSGKLKKARPEGWIILQGVLPISAIRGVHFRSEADREDFQSRALADVPTDLLPQVVSPAHFAPTFATLPDWPTVPDDAPAAAFTRVEALVGALVAARRVWPPQRRWLDILAQLQAARAGVAETRTWLSSLTGKGITSWEWPLLAHALDLLIPLRPADGFDPESFLADLLQTAASDASLQTFHDGIQHWGTTLRAILREEQPIPSLHDAHPEPTVDAARLGILLFLLRPSLERLQKTGQSALKPGPGVFTIATLLAGAFTKHERLPVAERGGPAQCRYDAEWKAAQLCRLLDLPAQAKLLEPQAPVLTIAAGLGMTQRKRIASGDVILYEREVSAPLVLRNISGKAEEAGFPMIYDPHLLRLSHVVRYQDGRQQTVYIDIGRPRASGEETVRIWTTCLDLTLAANRKRCTKDLLETLLLRNDAVNANCRFAMKEDKSALIVLQDQIVKTVDTEEIRAHIEDVTSVADAFESEMGWDHY